VAISPLLITCGNDTSSEGGVGGSGISMGRVSQIGSVYVNNIHYNTDSAVFVINGSETNMGLADIGVGMVVHLTGTKNVSDGTGFAERITYESLLVGPVDMEFNPLEKQIKVMGQTVLINDDTVVVDDLNDPVLTVSQLSANNIVEVSGYPVTSGVILATRIELKHGAHAYKVSGIVSSLDAASNGIIIGELAIDLSVIGQPLPEVGDYVRIVGRQQPSGGLFRADTLSIIQTDDLASDGEEFSLEGVITTQLDPLSHLFSVNGLIVDASATPYSTDETSLAAGRLVRVEGIMLDNVVLADEIELASTHARREKIGTTLESGAVDIDARTVTLMGKTVNITNSTIFENDKHGASTFSLEQLKRGDFLTAKVIDNNGEFTAIKLELDYTPSRYNATMEGNPSDLGGGYIEILGVMIDTSNVSGYRFQEERIEVTGNYDTATRILTATRIEEDDDDRHD
jgi:hypothetical protein